MEWLIILQVPLLFAFHWLGYNKGYKAGEHFGRLAERYKQKYGHEYNEKPLANESTRG